MCSPLPQVLELEEAKGEWGFKALKQIMKLHFRLVRPHAAYNATPTLYHAPPTLYHATPTPCRTTHSVSGLLRCQGNYEAMVACYRQLLTYIKGAVTRNYSEKSINSILDYISTSSNVSARPPSLPPAQCHTPSPPPVQAAGGAVQHNA